MLATYLRGVTGAAVLQAHPIEDRFKVERNKRDAQRSADRLRKIRKQATEERHKVVEEEEARRAARYAKVPISIQGELMPSLETRPRYHHPRLQRPLHPPSDDACWECKCIDYEH